MNIEWAKLEEGEWSLYLARTEKGLCYIGCDSEFKDFERSLGIYFPAAVLVENNKALRPYMTEIQEFLLGKRQAFSMDLDVKGTPFQEEVWEALAHIPYGQTVTYSDIAEKINRPQAVRAKRESNRCQSTVNRGSMPSGHRQKWCDHRLSRGH